MLMPRLGGYATEIVAQGCVSRITLSSSLIRCFKQAVRMITEIEVYMYKLVGNVGERTEGGGGRNKDVSLIPLVWHGSVIGGVW